MVELDLEIADGQGAQDLARHAQHLRVRHHQSYQQKNKTKQKLSAPFLFLLIEHTLSRSLATTARYSIVSSWVGTVGGSGSGGVDGGKQHTPQNLPFHP